MGILLAMLFGAVQGFTEFLPVSSSGHLALLSMLTLENSDLFFPVFLHIATFIAVCIVYRKDIGQLIKAVFLFIPRKITKAKSSSPTHEHMVGMLILSILPLFAILPFKDTVEKLFNSPLAIGIALLVTAALLFVANRYGDGKKTVADMTVTDAIIIGFVQLIAVVPGLSRSGATLAAALFCGLDRENAVRYSFILSLPTIIGAALVEGIGVLRGGTVAFDTIPYLAGFFVAAVTGLLAIGLVKKLIKSRKLSIFSIYTAALGIGLLITIALK